MATANADQEDEEVPPVSSFASRFKLRSRTSTVGNDRNTKLKNRALSAWNNLRNGSCKLWLDARPA